MSDNPQDRVVSNVMQAQLTARDRLDRVRECSVRVELLILIVRSTKAFSLEKR